MAFVTTGLFFMLFPGTFLSVWNLLQIIGRESVASIGVISCPRHFRSSLATNHASGIGSSNPELFAVRIPSIIVADMVRACYQMRQKFWRTIFCPSWQPKACLNSGILETTLLTRYLG